MKQPPAEKAWVPFLEELVRSRGESYRGASLDAGLDHGALHRFIKQRRRPTRESCIALAAHFQINPNELLQKAGYDPMPYFDPSLTDPHDYPPEVKAVAEALTRIADLTVRRLVCQGLSQVLAVCIRNPE